MLILIADSGSTKTDWVLLEGATVLKDVKTIGFNPYFQTAETISAEIEATLKPALQPNLPQIAGIHFYGTGCSTDENRNLIKNSLQNGLGISCSIDVSHDLLGAARALCKREEGIAGILGTGSNSCLYDGKEILENVPSTGYLWSDYGGGSQIGKYLVRDYFEKRLPAGLEAAFELEGYNREEILNNVYKKSIPSRYLAAVSLFVSKHLQEPYCQGLLRECFDSFFIYQISKYTDSKKYRVHTLGSVGFYFRDIVAEVAKKHGYQMGRVIKSPLEGLIEYHSH